MLVAMHMHGAGACGVSRASLLLLYCAYASLHSNGSVLLLRAALCLAVGAFLGVTSRRAESWQRLLALQSSVKVSRTVL